MPWCVWIVSWKLPGKAFQAKVSNSGFLTKRLRRQNDWHSTAAPVEDRENPAPSDADSTDVDPNSRTIPIATAGRRWTLKFSQTPEYLAVHRSLQAWGVLGGGMLCTGLLGVVLLVVTGRAELVAAMVEARTAELAEANATMKLEIDERKRVGKASRVREELLRRK